jgi:hypothetical protein
MSKIITPKEAGEWADKVWPECVKQALEQPVQEPVVFYRCNGCGHAYEEVHPTSCDCMDAVGFDRVEYYTTPPAVQRTWVDLTDEEINEWTPEIHSVIRTVLAKSKEKNT